MRREFEDIEFVVVAELEPQYQCSVDYTIYEILDGIILFNKAGSDSMESVEAIEEAQIFASGSVKWDGCSNWHFDITDDCMLHSCSREDLERISAVLVRCWDMTTELCPKMEGTRRES